MMRISIFFNFILFPFFVLAGETVNVEAILACDSVYQRPGCIGGGGGGRSHETKWESLRRRTGIVVEAEYGYKDLGEVRQNFELVDDVDVDDDDTSPRQGGIAAERAYDFENSRVSDAGDSVGGGDNNQQNSGNAEEQGAFNQSPRQQAQGAYPYSGGSGISALEVSGSPGGQAMVKGGLLYSNPDGVSPVKGNFKNENDPETVKAQQLASGQSAVRLNRQNSAVAPTAEKDFGNSDNPSRGLASVGAGGGGGFSAARASGGGTVNPAARGGRDNSSGGLIGRLTGIAKGLGERFFGLSGSGGKNAGRAGLNVAQAEKNRLKKLAALSKNDPNFRDMLQKHLRRQGGLASSLELGTKDSFLFERVCEQYSKYATENGIPDDRVSCPNR